jgi:hypothetical protein
MWTGAHVDVLQLVETLAQSNLAVLAPLLFGRGGDGRHVL